MTTDKSSSRTLWILFAIAAVITVAAFFIPGFIIRPFAYQSPRGLLLAMAVRQHAPIISPLFGIAALVFAVLLWSRTRIWGKIGLVILMIPVVFSAVMSRINYFEWMFHPVESAQFDAASASKLDAGEMILAVRYGTDARAYPIREMAYHHILNDVVEGVPIAVTY